MFLRRQQERERKQNIYNTHTHMNTYITYLSTRPNKHIANVSKKTTREGEKTTCIYIHTHMNTYITYVSTRPKQTHRNKLKV